MEGGFEPSVGSVGDCYDNALAETINGLYKAEVIHRRGPWRSFEAVEFATLTWVDWSNKRRLLEPIGNIPPAEAEERYLRHAGRTGHGRVTQTKWPPANPGRFRGRKLTIMISCLTDLLKSSGIKPQWGSFGVTTRPGKTQNAKPDDEPEVPLQVTVPKRVKRALDLKSVETGRTRRALVLEALREVGVSVTDDEIAGRRGVKKR